MDSDLYRVKPEEYGDQYREHLLEQYKLFLASVEKISDRRLISNSFFLTINTALVGAVGFVFRGGGPVFHMVFVLFIAFAGCVLCLIWNRLVRSYKDLNSAKFKIVHEFEAQLPAAPWDREWDLVKRGGEPKLYLPFTVLELRVPWVFFGMHLVAVLGTLAWLACSLLDLMERA